MYTAYLVVFNDIQARTIRSAGIYSEPSPTTAQGIQPICIAEIVSLRTYAEAEQSMRHWVRNSGALLKVRELLRKDGYRV